MQAIDKISVNEKRVLVTANPVQAVNFEHAIEVQANIKTRQNLDLILSLEENLIVFMLKEGQAVKKVHF